MTYHIRVQVGGRVRADDSIGPRRGRKRDAGRSQLRARGCNNGGLALRAHLVPCATASAIVAGFRREDVEHAFACAQRGQQTCEVSVLWVCLLPNTRASRTVIMRDDVPAPTSQVSVYAERRSRKHPNTISFTHVGDPRSSQPHGANEPSPLSKQWGKLRVVLGRRTPPCWQRQTMSLINESGIVTGPGRQTEGLQTRGGVFVGPTPGMVLATHAHLLGAVEVHSK